MRNTIVAVRDVGLDLVTGLEVAGEQLGGERIDHELLQRALERTRTVHRIVASLGDPGDCLVGEVERRAGARRAACRTAAIWIRTICASCGLAERLEEDDLVDPVQELGPERRLELAHRERLDLRAVVVGQLQQVLAADVARHDDDGVLEVDRAALAVGEPAVVEHLQQHAPHVGVRLLDLVEQHDRCTGGGARPR